MKTVSARLTLLYVGSVACVLFGLLFVGYALLERNLVSNLDRMLQTRFGQLKERVGAEAVQGSDFRGLLASSQLGDSVTVEVDDLWNVPEYREARLRGEPVSPDLPLRFFDRNASTESGERIIEGDHESLRIRIVAPLAPVHDALHAYAQAGTFIAVATLLLSAIAGKILARIALRPVRAIERTARRISRANLSERIAVGAAGDEISRLARLLNEMFERLELAFAEIRTFSADVSHEIKTPLSLVRLNIERTVLSEPISEASRTAMLDCIEEIDRLTRMVERLLFLSRAEAGEVELERQSVDSKAFIEGFLHDAEVLAESHGVQLEISSNEAGIVGMDSARIRQVLLNLLSNALAALSHGGSVTLAATWHQGTWQVTMKDSGPGLSEEHCTAIFARFYRGPGKSGSGAGLGLAICKSIIELHGGQISARPNEGESGLSVSFSLPSDGHTLGPG